MKSIKKSATGLILALLVLEWAGCKTHGTVTPIGDGYEEVSHPIHNYIALADPQSPRVSFQYRSADDHVTPIWSSLYGVNEVVNDGVAVFLGDKAYLSPDRGTRPRLFAVKSPDLPVDITDEVLREWAQATRRSFQLAQDKFTLATPVEKDGRLELRLEFSPENESGDPGNWPEQSALLLEWNQLDDIMRTVKANGSEQKDLAWKTPYIGETAKRK